MQITNQLPVLQRCANKLEQHCESQKPKSHRQDTNSVLWIDKKEFPKQIKIGEKALCLRAEIEQYDEVQQQFCAQSEPELNPNNPLGLILHPVAL